MTLTEAIQSHFPTAFPPRGFEPDAVHLPWGDHLIVLTTDLHDDATSPSPIMIGVYWSDDEWLNDPERTIFAANHDEAIHELRNLTARIDASGGNL